MPPVRRIWSVKKQFQVECVGTETFGSIPRASIRPNPYFRLEKSVTDGKYRVTNDSCIAYHV